MGDNVWASLVQLLKSGNFILTVLLLTEVSKQVLKRLSVKPNCSPEVAGPGTAGH